MCRNQVEARMHQLGDGDLGAIVRSASQNSSQLLELGANFPFQAQMFRHSSNPASSSMRLMDLISGTVVPVELPEMGHQGFSMGGMDPSSPSSGYGRRAPEGLIPVEKLEVKKEIEEGSMHEIFSSTRSLPPYNSFADDIKEGILHRDDLFNPCPPDVVPLFQNCARISPSDAIANQPWSSGDTKSDLLPSLAKENSSNGPGSSSKQGSKRSRKMQQKRIVCVPMGGGGKPTGEVLPSDMWAWRKYGQKPIKGSPYPRGYYRCSSSKGCSARKQVERSRTDPSMLIITYTSEHNHPWPVHRNSLAGTTRIRPQLANSQDPNQTAQQDKTVPDSEKNCAGRENPFVSIINSSNSGLGESMVNENANDSKDVMSIDNISRSSSPEEDLFSELEELPELSTILEKGGFLEYKSDDEGSASRIVDAYHLFASWPHHPAPNPAAKNGGIKTEAVD